MLCGGKISAYASARSVNLFHTAWIFPAAVFVCTQVKVKGNICLTAYFAFAIAEVS